MKKVLIISFIVVSILALSVYLLINKLNKDVESILDESIVDIQLDTVADGTYEGEYNKALAVNALVEVTVVNNVITDIRIIEHQNGKGAPAEEIIMDIIGSQSLLVDDISGATYSSRVLKLAVYDALKE
jgi:uncharacterized protein with FMN-binding domain